MAEYSRGLSSSDLNLSEKEFLLQCGYDAHQIEERSDGSARLNLDFVLLDWRNRLFSRSLTRSDLGHT